MKASELKNKGIKFKLNDKEFTSPGDTYVYSDDAVEDIITAFEGVYVEIEVNQLSLISRAKLQGSKVVKGVLIENKDDIAPMLFTSPGDTYVI